MSTTETAPQAAGTGPRNLEGRVAVVTGGTRGIGAAICRSLARDGAVVAAGYTRNTDAAEQFLDELRSELDDVEASLHKGNVGEFDDCQRVVQEVLEERGRIDILVNNAGINEDKPVLKLTQDDWDKVVRVNLSGAFYMAKPVLEHMIDRGSGRIVNISSVIGEMGNIGQANYAASKSGMFGLTRTLAREAAQALQKKEVDVESLGVTVNAVTPGFIDTDMTANLPEKVVDSLIKRIPLGRFGHPDEVARVVHFLCADPSSYITGQVWGVNGGLEM
ncbi:MAG: beta-ketoacyl-ACP reductase [Actinomycetota bacterium]|nr:beta-ketoacyl-ACP reductase [Actinomycetota bacterium]